MLKWLKAIFKKKNKPLPLKHTCEKCVYWKSEAENNIQGWISQNKRYCDVYKMFTKPNHTCAMYVEEKFEAKPDSISTPELTLDYDLSIEESDLIDPKARQK